MNVFIKKEDAAMPKLIPDLQRTILETARAVLTGEGYSALSLREIAGRCSIAVGTIYNYYRDKDTLVAEVMLEDWRVCLDAVRAAAEDASDPGPVLRAMHREISHFAGQYRDLFQDKKARRSFASAFSRYHGQLRGALAEPLRPFFPDSFTPEFIAEALITWTVEGLGYEKLEPIFTKLYERRDDQ